LAVCERSPNDLRAKCFRLTSDGIDRLALVDRDADARLTEMCMGLGASEADRLRILLGSLADGYGCRKRRVEARSILCVPRLGESRGPCVSSRGRCSDPASRRSNGTS
jgi:hypothetical protein